MNNWKTIWNNKEVVSRTDAGDEFLRFCELKKANGFDVNVGSDDYYRMFYEEWLAFFDKLKELAGDFSSVYEVGCGSGVNLYMMGNRLADPMCLGGCDYSESMIESAKISTGCDDFTCCGASEIEDLPQYDVVMSESVFQYFESLDYAKSVLEKMIKKSKKVTYLGEIHNKEYEQELLDYRRKTIEDYDTRYEGLSKLFISKEWIIDIAAGHGKKVEFTNVNNSEYINGKYEYNCFIY